MLQNIIRLVSGPRCPITQEQKKWIEAQFAWMRQQFGPDPIRRPPLDPDSSLLPRKWDRSEKAGLHLFELLSQFMSVDPARLQLDYYLKDELGDVRSQLFGSYQHVGPAGLYFPQIDGEKLVIAVDKAQLEIPLSLCAVICHELGHVLLLADGRIEREAEDCEPLTDLLTVYFGAGILSANAAYQFYQWHSPSEQGWHTCRQGYLTEEVYGYALACYAWCRGETKPPWARYLKENIRCYFDDSRHYLAKTKDISLPFGADKL
ncbi:MAG TPA: hypothetical protein VMF06_14925 [Candidatus Limnocylindria bacterium]|jgi:hypothetical protein|nr:hypothetical protein [Candidatus Limnocylindria bacterium]